MYIQPMSTTLKFKKRKKKEKEKKKEKVPVYIEDVKKLLPYPWHLHWKQTDFLASPKESYKFWTTPWLPNIEKKKF